MTTGITLHLSRSLEKRLKCQTETVEQDGRLDGWSGHFLRIGSTPVIFMMNDLTLYTLIIPAKGITSQSAFLTVFLQRLTATWAEHGISPDCIESPPAFASRTNRSLIGSMNNAAMSLKCLAALDRESNITPKWERIEEQLNETPYSVLEYEHPARALQKALLKPRDHAPNNVESSEKSTNLENLIPATSTSEYFQIRITLNGSDPPIWRRLLVPSKLPLSKFHRILQITMGWKDYHLHQFLANGKCYGIPDPDYGDDILDAKKFLLSDILSVEGESIGYEYDFGDGWDHTIVLEHVASENSGSPPQCLEGQRACPPEDCGGIWGYRDILLTLADPSHSEYEELSNWVGDDFDPEIFPISKINKQLSRGLRRER